MSQQYDLEVVLKIDDRETKVHPLYLQQLQQGQRYSGSHFERDGKNWRQNYKFTELDIRMFV